MPDQPSFPGFELRQPSRPKDRLFLGVFLDLDAAERAANLSRNLRKELNLKGRPLPPERSHITRPHIDDYAGLPPQVVAAICDAAAKVGTDPFEVEFDRVASFSGRPGNRPLVLSLVKTPQAAIADPDRRQVRRKIQADPHCDDIEA